MEERAPKMWPVYAVQFYAASKRKGAQTQAATRMDLEDTVLSGKSQAQWTSTAGFPLHEVPGGVGLGETDSGRVVARGWQEGKDGEFGLNGDRVSGLQDGNQQSE